MGDWIIAEVICSLLAFLFIYPLCRAAGDADRAMENYKTQDRNDER